MRLSLLILGSFFSACATANVYKCTDADGKTEYRSTACETGLDNQELNIKSGASQRGQAKFAPLKARPNPSSLQNLQDADKDKKRLAKAETEKKQAKINQAAVIQSAKNQFLIKNNPEHYSAYAIPPYAPDQLPDVVKPFKARLDEIELLRKQAAEKALASQQCQRVEAVELHTKSTKTALTFLINCSSGKAFYFTEQQLAQ